MTPGSTPSNATENGVETILDHCRLLVRPALRAALEQLPAAPGRMAGYALGLWEADGTPRRAAGGKGLRPAIAVLGARAAGGAARAAVPGAVAVELVHAFSLVHDDIIDGDERRRHRAAVWKAYGVGPAVLSGDALLALAVRTLATAGGAAAVGYLSSALLDLVRGQADDMAFEERPGTGPGAVTVEEYTAMAAGKTGALLGCAAAVGVLLGGGGAGLAETLARVGRHLGVAFQAVDDLLGISGDPDLTGKPLYGDLRRGKKTLPIVYALNSGTPAGRRLATLLATRPQSPASLKRAATLVDKAGGRAYTHHQAQHHLNQALTLIKTAGLPPPAAADLTSLSHFLINRHH